MENVSLINGKMILNPVTNQISQPPPPNVRKAFLFSIIDESLTLIVKSDSESLSLSYLSSLCSSLRR